MSFKVNKYLPTLVLAFLCAKTVAVVPCVEVSWLFVFVMFFVVQSRINVLQFNSNEIYEDSE